MFAGEKNLQPELYTDVRWAFSRLDSYGLLFQPVHARQSLYIVLLSSHEMYVQYGLNSEQDSDLSHFL